jgi:hypothetical protein
VAALLVTELWAPGRPSISCALNTAGGKELILCSAAWSNERWPFFGVEEFPDLEAVQRHEQILTDLNWARYMDSRTTLGTEFIPPQ